MRIAVLGRLRVLDAAHEEVCIRPGTATRLLCLLLAHAPDPVDVGTLCERLWWGRPPPAAVATVRANIHWLRRVLGADRIGTSRTPAAYSLRVLPGELDLDEFKDLATRGQRAWRSGDAHAAFAQYEQALALWRGRPFADLGDAPDIAKVVREFEVRHVQALGDYYDAGLALGRHLEILPRLVGPTVDFPGEERFRRLLMLAMYRAGRGTEAIGAYEEFRAHLSEEYGAEPSDELRELYYAIARRDPELDSRPPDASRLRADTAGAGVAVA